MVAELAQATLASNPRVDWVGWVADYATVRDAFEATYPEEFKDFNRRLFEPGGVNGTRMVLFMNENDIARLDLEDGIAVDVATESSDAFAREVKGLRIVKYEIPEGNCAGYYPELNVLVPLWHHDAQSKTPAAKAIPVRIVRAAAQPSA